ncbi:BrnA antitoxin family protein [Thauera humireducens]|uniref:BrnA antitoxin family protein n=1 Tax=Thauera humireducens TaxID=1134435 RepID=UPI00311E6326
MLRAGRRVCRRQAGAPGRPRTDRPKVALTVRYDADVVEAFRSTGKGWQTRMNAALKDWLKTHSPT